MDQDIKRAINKCASCGQCRAVCPAFKAAGLREPESPRGKVLMTRALLEGEVPWTSGAGRTLAKCLLCNSCVAECPSSVAVDKIILKARERKAAEMGTPPFKRFLAAAFTNPRLMALGVRLGSWGLGLMGTYPAGGHPLPPRWLPWRGKRRTVPSLPRKPFSARIRPRGEPSFHLFRGCLIEHVTPGVGLAVSVLARRNGDEPGLVKDEICCGIPLLASGDVEGFQRVIAHNVEAFSSRDLPVVTACATCTSTLRKYYPMFAPEKIQDKVEAFSSRVKDAVEVLSEYELTSQGREGVWTYHQPCHHHKGHDQKVDGSLLLDRVPGVSMVLPSDRDACCGFGGSYSLDAYDDACQLADERLADLMATGAEGVATGCPGCIIHLRDAVARGNHTFKVQHVAQVVWEMTRQDP